MAMVICGAVVDPPPPSQRDAYLGITKYVLYALYVLCIMCGSKMEQNVMDSMRRKEHPTSY